jgi:hypothetical protein
MKNDFCYLVCRIDDGSDNVVMRRGNERFSLANKWFGKMFTEFLVAKWREEEVLSLFLFHLTATKRSEWDMATNI